MNHKPPSIIIIEFNGYLLNMETPGGWRAGIQNILVSPVNAFIQLFTIYVCVLPLEA
jgi:hypothetical protein